MCQEVGTEPSLPRCGQQHHRQNTPADTTAQYYGRTISIPFVDYLLTEIEARFTRMHLTALQGPCLVPAMMLIMPPDMAKEKVMHFAQMYKEDLDSSECPQWAALMEDQVDAEAEHIRPAQPTFHGNHSTTAGFLHVSKHSDSAEDPVYHASNNVHFWAFPQWAESDQNHPSVNHGQWTAHWPCLATSASEDTSRHNSSAGWVCSETWKENQSINQNGDV